MLSQTTPAIVSDIKEAVNNFNQTRLGNKQAIPAKDLLNEL